jgi:hypothetical protein
LADKEDPSGAGRRRTEDRGKALAGKSTLNRLELTPKEAGKQGRYKKIVAQTEAMDTLLVEVFVESHAVSPKEIVIDVDATDDPLHGDQDDPPETLQGPNGVNRVNGKRLLLRYCGCCGARCDLRQDYPFTPFQGGAGRRGVTGSIVATSRSMGFASIGQARPGRDAHRDMPRRRRSRCCAH